MVRINALLSEDMIKELDKIAKDEHTSRSSLLREAAVKLIEEHKHRVEERLRRERMGKAIDTQNRLRKKSGKWNGVAEVSKRRRNLLSQQTINS